MTSMQTIYGVAANGSAQPDVIPLVRCTISRSKLVLGPSEASLDAGFNLKK